jgi:ubiquinone/menaquinone biosynthesis C-methylase UbiE
MMRRRMFQRFLSACALQTSDRILDVGVTSDRTYASSNYLEAWYPHKHQITAVGVDDASFLEELYPGVKFQRADGRSLPFPDQSFDVVHSSAVLEHVGSRASQRRLLSELARVARRAVFVTTPNRWYPVEFHTGLPLIHWLPQKQFRGLLRFLGQEFLAREENLNLLGASDFRTLTRELPDCTVEFQSVRLLGIPSNLILVLTRSKLNTAPTAMDGTGVSRPHELPSTG